MHPGIDVHFDLLLKKEHSVETFDPKGFIKITVFLTSEQYLLCFIFFSKAYGGVPQFLVEFNTLLILCEKKKKLECLHGKRN